MAKHNFDRECKIVGLYIDSAKSYAQLATGALALAAVFATHLFEGWINANVGLIVACMCFLIAVLSSGAYQSLAVGRLEELSELPVDRTRLLKSWYDNAYVAYNVMMWSFHAGVLTLAVVAIIRMLHRTALAG
jgi:hypothetical protein